MCSDVGRSPAKLCFLATFRVSVSELHTLTLSPCVLKKNIKSNFKPESAITKPDKHILMNDLEAGIEMKHIWPDACSSRRRYDSTYVCEFHKEEGRLGPEEPLGPLDRVELADAVGLVGEAAVAFAAVPDADGYAFGFGEVTVGALVELVLFVFDLADFLSEPSSISGAEAFDRTVDCFLCHDVSPF